MNERASLTQKFFTVIFVGIGIACCVCLASAKAETGKAPCAVSIIQILDEMVGPRPPLSTAEGVTSGNKTDHSLRKIMLKMLVSDNPALLFPAHLGRFYPHYPVHSATPRESSIFKRLVSAGAQYVLSVEEFSLNKDNPKELVHLLSIRYRVASPSEKSRIAEDFVTGVLGKYPIIQEVDFTATKETGVNLLASFNAAVHTNGTVAQITGEIANAAFPDYLKYLQILHDIPEDADEMPSSCQELRAIVPAGVGMTICGGKPGLKLSGIWTSPKRREEKDRTARATALYESILRSLRAKFPLQDGSDPKQAEDFWRKFAHDADDYHSEFQKILSKSGTETDEIAIGDMMDIHQKRIFDSSRILRLFQELTLPDGKTLEEVFAPGSEASSKVSRELIRDIASTTQKRLTQLELMLGELSTLRQDNKTLRKILQTSVEGTPAGPTQSIKQRQNLLRAQRLAPLEPLVNAHEETILAAAQIVQSLIEYVTQIDHLARSKYLEGAANLAPNAQALSELREYAAKMKKIVQPQYDASL